MRLLATALIATAVLAGSAQAQVTVDVAKITCEQFVFSKLANPRSIAIWLSGYYAGKRDTTQVDTQTFEATADAVERACRLPQNLKLPLMQVAAQVIDQRK